MKVGLISTLLVAGTMAFLFAGTSAVDDPNKPGPSKPQSSDSAKPGRATNDVSNW